jgi:glycosyltransferase involved in cell wall biosynthesis
MEVSIIILAKNEEQKIAGCLKSAAWADEVLLVDTGSTDETKAIAKKHGARIVEFQDTGNFADRRNYGLKKAKGDWLFYLDADERITPELKKEIQEIVSRESAVASSGYAVPRRNFIFGQEFRHGGQWPDYQKRFFQKSKLKKWVGAVHEEPVFTGDLEHLQNPLIHLKHNDLTEMVDKTNSWSEIEAQLMLEAGHPKMNIPRFLSAMAREFWLRMIRQLAFLDGPRGIIYALYQVFSRFVSYAKLWERQNARSNL